MKQKSYSKARSGALKHKIPDTRSAIFRNLNLLATVMVFILMATYPVFALQNNVGSHDPSSIVKDGSRYWIFTTGDGIYSCYSDDMIWWTAGQTPYTKTNYPSWINSYVPGFAGTFWAPECIYMNGKYYLYYGCSTFGSKVSCIGLATSTSLNSPNWQDQGVVVYSNNSSNFNAIDPDVFFDTNGNLWLSYGSWNSGIKMQQLNTSSGKPLNSTQYSVCTFSDAENSQVVYHGGYYYLFVNRGLCCQGSNSTYYIQVGRSTTVNGNYSGWRTVLSSSGNYIGPGALGYYNGDGAEWATFHYYDGDDNGNPKLAIGNYSWSGGWPVISLNWFSNGTYEITNVNSGLVWDNWGCTGNAGEAIAQNTYSGAGCQEWVFTQLGNGYYEITSSLSGRAVDAIGCSASAGTNIDVWDYWGGTCQIWHVERTNTGSYVFSSKNGNRVIEVPNASTATGVQLGLWDYNGNNCQKWTIAPGSGGSSGGGSTTSYVQFQNRTTGLYIDGMGRTSNGDNCGQWSSSSSYNQQWVIESAGSYVKLMNRATGLYLDGMGRTSNGSAAGQWSSSSSNNQQWSEETTGSYVKFRNRSSGLYLDGMGRTSNGSDLGQWSSSSSYNQQWSVISVKNAEEIIKPIKNVNVSIYPNPVSSGVINIRLMGMTGNISIRLLDMNGKIIQEMQVADKSFIQMHANVLPGFYIMQIVNDKNTVVKKLLVK